MPVRLWPPCGSGQENVHRLRPVDGCHLEQMEGKPMTAVRINPRKKRGQDREPPFVYLYCDTRGCAVNERLCMTTFEGLGRWLKANDWVTVWRGGHLFDHRCPECERRRVGLTPAYRARLQA